MEAGGREGYWEEVGSVEQDGMLWVVFARTSRPHRFKVKTNAQTSRVRSFIVEWDGSKLGLDVGTQLFEQYQPHLAVKVIELLQQTRRKA